MFLQGAQLRGAGVLCLRAKEVKCIPQTCLEQQHAMVVDLQNQPQ